MFLCKPQQKVPYTLEGWIHNDQQASSNFWEKNKKKKNILSEELICLYAILKWFMNHLTPLYFSAVWQDITAKATFKFFSI